MRDAFGLQRAGGEPGAYGRNAERERKADAVLAREDRDDKSGKRSSDSSPPSRLVRGSEIKDDAEAIGDRQPWHQPSGRDFGERPLRQHLPQPLGGDADASGSTRPARRRAAPMPAAQAFARGCSC